jgi:hypothetical protein
MKRQGEPEPRLFDIRTYVEGYDLYPPDALQIVKEMYRRTWRSYRPKDHWLYQAQGYTMRQCMQLGFSLTDEDFVERKDYHYMPIWEFEELIEKFMAT